jgi:hypothetical protein
MFLEFEKQALDEPQTWLVFRLSGLPPTAWRSFPATSFPLHRACYPFSRSFLIRRGGAMFA